MEDFGGAINKIRRPNAHACPSSKSTQGDCLPFGNMPTTRSATDIWRWISNAPSFPRKKSCGISGWILWASKDARRVSRRALPGAAIKHVLIFRVSLDIKSPITSQYRGYRKQSGPMLEGQRGSRNTNDNVLYHSLSTRNGGDDETRTRDLCRDSIHRAH